jgi:hypothetical protein
MGGFIEPLVPEQATVLHKRLLAGDVTASAEIADAYFEKVNKYSLDQWSHRYPNDLIEDAAVNTFVNYLENPNQYDAQRTTLGRFFIMSIHGDLLNLMAKDSRHGVIGLPRRKKNGENLSIPSVSHQDQFVELDDPIMEHKIGGSSDLSVEEHAFVRSAPIWSKLDALFLDTKDRDMLYLILEDVRDTSEFAEVLEITDLPIEIQESEVKRHKDRIKKTIQRHIYKKELKT